MRTVIGLCAGMLVYLVLHVPVFPAAEGKLVLVEQRQGDSWYVTDVTAKKALFGRTHKRWVEVPAEARSTIILSEDFGTTIVYTPVDVVWTLVAYQWVDQPAGADKYLDEVWKEYVEKLLNANIQIAYYDLMEKGEYDIDYALVEAADKTNKNFEEIGVKIRILRVGVPQKMPQLLKEA